MIADIWLSYATDRLFCAVYAVVAAAYGARSGDDRLGTQCP